MAKRAKKELTWDEVKKRKEAKAAYDKEYKARKKAEKQGPLNPTSPLPYPEPTPKTPQKQAKQTRFGTKKQKPAQDQAPAAIAPQKAQNGDGMVPFKAVEYPHVTRAELMKEAQNKGIKYFRILNREELQAVLDPNTPQDIKQLTIESAKLRWKAGWGKRGQK